MSAKDAEVEDILGIFNVLDTASALERAKFPISSLDRLPGLYSPEEIDLYAVVDRQTQTDAVLSALTESVAAISPTRDSSTASVIGGVTAAVNMLKSNMCELAGGSLCRIS